MKNTGNNFRRGQAMLVAVFVLFFFTLSVVAYGASSVVRDVRAAEVLGLSKRIAIISENGIEDVTFRISSGLAYESSEVLTTSDGEVVTEVSDDILSGEKIVASLADISDSVRKKEVRLVNGVGVGVNYGVQAGQGGFVMNNSSVVHGNVYSNNTVSGAGNLITGTIISSGSDGFINDMESGEDMYAHSIADSLVGRDAHYTSISGTTVGRTSYPGSSDLPDLDLPITDEQIEAWEQIAQDGGSSPCSKGSFVIQSVGGPPIMLGPIKINCDLIIKNSPNIVLGGPVWVNGNLTVQNSPNISISPSLGAMSLPFIVDKVANRATGGLISLGNSSTYLGSGHPNSFVYFISGNTSAESSGSLNAIAVSNSLTGVVVLYSNHGKVQIGNSANIVAAAAYKIEMLNSAQFYYDEGLASTLFTSGPTGGWEITSWWEVE